MTQKQVLKFPTCECKFEVIKENSILFNPNIENIHLDCVATWDLISEGNTKGVFQLESRLGQMLAKKLKPRNIEHLAALVSIIRPGVLEAMRPNDEGKMISVTEHYIARKNGQEAVTYFHPALKHSLEPTYGEMIYQEQAMQIARDIAGFDLQEADILRKAIGKKKAKIMSEVKTKFLNGTKKVGIVDSEIAEQIFEWIEKSQRYSFNKAHAVSYAINAYLSAYVKAHFKKEFFTSYLYHAKTKQKPHEEINELVNNAKLMNVNIQSPDLRKRNERFRLIGEDVFFGLTDIKGVGLSVYKRLNTLIEQVEIKLNRNIAQWSWSDFLIFITPYINSSAIDSIITVAIHWMNQSRQHMRFDFEQYIKLSKRERDWIENQYLAKNLSNISLSDILNMLLSSPVGRTGGIANKNRAAKIKDIAKLVDSPPISLLDSPTWISAIEDAVLGIPLTCTIIDECNREAANITCKEFINNTNKSKVLLMAIKIDDIKEITTKRGQNPGAKMAFVTVSDETASLESVILFPNIWTQYKPMFFVDNTLMLAGAKNREKDSFIVTKVWQI